MYDFQGPQGRPCGVEARDLRRNLTIPVAAAIIASRFRPLSKPGKMPGFAWGIPAFQCKRGEQLAQEPGTVCHACYARIGWYCARNVAKTQYARMEGLAHPRWADAMTYLIKHCVDGWFRWFDSGDLQSLGHLAQVVRICEDTPKIRHWLPTHEPYMIGDFLDQGGEFPPNLCIRISADYIESGPTTPTFGLPTSTVHRFRGEPVPFETHKRNHTLECMAFRNRQGYGRRRSSSCGRCRACWDPRVRNISYKLH